MRLSVAAPRAAEKQTVNARVSTNKPRISFSRTLYYLTLPTSCDQSSPQGAYLVQGNPQPTMAILTHCLAVLAFFLSGAIADDPWSHGTGTYPVLGQGVVYACDGPNWTGRCWLSDESIINECLPWTMTWTWLRSIAIGPWTSCNVFTQSDCTSDSYWFHTNQADLNLVGWQFRVAGIGCYFDYDLDSKVDAASLPKPTATASVSPPLPFPAIANASEISGSTSTLVTQYSTPTAVVTPTELTPRGSPGAVFMCYGPDWTAPCIYIQPQMGTCHSLEDRAASPIGFGPDPDAICHVFKYVQNHQLLSLEPR